MNSQEHEWLLGEKYQGEKSDAFWADAARLEAGEPLAYVIGHIPFLNTTIDLTSRPLIPRPETEYWTSLVIDELNKLDSNTPLAVLDLCAGSGAIGVAIGHALPSTLLHFIELDSAHLPTIAKNCIENGIERERVHILTGDLFAVNEPLPRFAAIVSNPPYIDPALDRAEASVKAFEPSIALYGGTSGMNIIERIIKEAPNHLLPHGLLYIEHEPEQVEAIKLLGEKNFSVSTHNDQYGVARFSKLVLQ